MKQQVTTGLVELDRLVGNLFVGDNVIWYDDAGSLADVFYLQLLRATLEARAPLIYVSFDRSLKNLLEKLGALADSPLLTVIDCFTFGKGNGDKLFVEYQTQIAEQRPLKLITVRHPERMEDVAAAFYQHHQALGGTVRFVFESLTGMQDLWGGEDQLIGFYVRTCPRLYDLNTIAYWLIEKQAHSGRLRAQINQIAQVVIELNVRRGKTSLRIIKAENRTPQGLDKPFSYGRKNGDVHFGHTAPEAGKPDLGERLRRLRLESRFSQTDLARQIGVTPSTISQIEAGLIYPSLPALYRMAEVFGLDMGALFREGHAPPEPLVFRSADFQIDLAPGAEAAECTRWHAPRLDERTRHTLRLVDLAPGARLAAHFGRHKGEEFGYVLSGRLQVTHSGRVLSAEAGDLIFIQNEWPAAWSNPGVEPARLIWITVHP